MNISLTVAGIMLGFMVIAFIEVLLHQYIPTKILDYGEYLHKKSGRTFYWLYTFATFSMAGVAFWDTPIKIFSFILFFVSLLTLYVMYDDRRSRKIRF